MKVSQIRRVLTSYSSLRRRAGDESGADALKRFAQVLASADGKTVKRAVDDIRKKRLALK